MYSLTFLKADLQRQGDKESYTFCLLAHSPDKRKGSDCAMPKSGTQSCLPITWCVISVLLEH